MESTSPIEGWWFSASHVLPHGDGRKIKIGKTHKIQGRVVPCRNGLHMSVSPLDALKYAPGPIVWKVQVSGKIVPHGCDKHAASERTYLAGGVDASTTLQKFARLCALNMVKLWDAPDVVVNYLKSGDEKLKSAAWSAARSAAESAAQSAAEYAAESATQYAAQFAAEYAAEFAAESAAESAAQSAAQSAARYAAWYAAWSAARSDQNNLLSSMLNTLIETHGEK